MQQLEIIIRLSVGIVLTMLPATALAQEPRQKRPDIGAAIGRGLEFLATVPGGKGSTSLIPITGAGSAWAVLGLVRSR